MVIHVRTLGAVLGLSSVLTSGWATPGTASAFPGLPSPQPTDTALERAVETPSDESRRLDAADGPSGDAGVASHTEVRSADTARDAEGTAEHAAPRQDIWVEPGPGDPDSTIEPALDRPEGSGAIPTSDLVVPPDVVRESVSDRFARF